MPLEAFPAINASLNTATAILLVLGYTLIRQRAITAHTVAMLTATLTSAIFLACYLYYHFHHGTTRFQGHGWIRPVYFMILTSHTILAAAQAPLIIMTLYRAFRGQFSKHIVLARVTLPIWL